MSYSIQYAQGTTRKYPLKKNNKRVNRKTLLFLCCIIAVVVFSLHITSVRRLVLPGDPEITEMAITKMVDDLQAGESLGDALDTFCEEVIRGGIVDE